MIYINLRDENPDLLSGVSPQVSISRATVKIAGNSDSITTNITGVSEEYADMKSLNVTNGLFLNYMDVKNNSKVCVVGTYIQKEFFGVQSALGQTIKINGKPYNVIGVLEEKDDSESGGSDDVIYIPYTTALRNGTSSSVSSYTLTAVSEDKAESALALVKSKLTEILGDDDYFTATSMAEMIEKVNEMTGTMKMLLVAIAGISLLVGGIGIMNIMLVSVTERTRGDWYKEVARGKSKRDNVTIRNRGRHGQRRRGNTRYYSRVCSIDNSRKSARVVRNAVNRCGCFVVRRVGRNRCGIRIPAGKERGKAQSDRRIEI